MRSLVVAMLLAGLVISGGCGGGGGGDEAPRTTTSTAAATSTPTTFGGIVGDAATQACVADAQAVQTASDAYAAMQGEPAASIDALVAGGQLRSAPASDHGYVIGYDAATGHVTARGACTVP